MLEGKRIILGVCGGIAAYKIPWLVRSLVKAGAEVQVILTSSALQFVSDLTLATLSKKPALSQYTFQQNGSSTWNNHVELGLWADIMMVAPLTASTLAKMANGQSDNLLLATYLSARCPVVVAPAMDLDMYAHPSTIRNLNQLAADGVHIIPADSGPLASGLDGQGRMPEPEALLLWIESFFQKPSKLKNKKVLINAGPTYEAIDPVRFIGNHSSGKMGLALASAAYKRGARVHFIHGPMALSIPKGCYQVSEIVSAQDMLQVCEPDFLDADVAILSAAVADYRPKNVAEQKIKKSSHQLTLELEPTPDVLATLGRQKTEQFLVGFALETENVLQNAIEKLRKKNLDLLVANQAGTQTGFGVDTNEAILVFKDETYRHTGFMSKTDLAERILDAIEEKL